MGKILKSKRTVIDKRITADSVADLNKQLAELGINEKSAVGNTKAGHHVEKTRKLVNANTQKLIIFFIIH